MTHTVKDEHALPAPPLNSHVPQLRYVRCVLAPTDVVCGATGDNYRRSDGKPWDADGYFVDRKSNGSVEVMKATAALSGAKGSRQKVAGR